MDTESKFHLRKSHNPFGRNNTYISNVMLNTGHNYARRLYRHTLRSTLIYRADFKSVGPLDIQDVNDYQKMITYCLLPRRNHRISRFRSVRIYLIDMNLAVPERIAKLRLGRFKIIRRMSNAYFDRTKLIYGYGI